MKRPAGYVTVSGIVDAEGKAVSPQRAIDYGWIKPTPGRTPAGWGIENHEIPLGKNLFLDQGRQLMAFCFGFRSPIEDYVCRKFGVGTGTTAAAVTDVALESAVTLDNALTTKAIDGVDFLSPFVVRVSYTLSVNDANGSLLTERGLFSGNGTMLARHVTSAGVSKTSDFSPVFSWRLRF